MIEIRANYFSLDLIWCHFFKQNARVITGRSLFQA
jgi:hypothetical protein